MLGFCYSKMFSTSGNNSVVECDLAKVEVAGSNPVSRSILRFGAAAEDAHHSSRSEQRWADLRDVSFGWQANLRRGDVKALCEMAT